MPQTHTKPDPGPAPSTPGWVKVFGVIFAILVLLFVILHLTGNSLGGMHGYALPVEPSEYLS